MAGRRQLLCLLLTFLPFFLSVSCGPPKCPKTLAPAYYGAATDDVYEVLVGAEGAAEVSRGYAPFAAGEYSAADGAPEWSWAGAARHLPPITGDVFWVRAQLANGCVVNAVTTEKRLRLEDEQWAEIVAAKGTVTVEMIYAYVQENRITEGPYRTAPFSFTVK